MSVYCLMAFLSVKEDIMRDTLAEQKQSPLSVDDVTAMVAGQIGQLAPMDKETADLFQQLMKKMIEQAGK